MSKPSKLIKPKNALTIFKVVRAVLIGFVLFSVVQLAPLIQMHAKTLLLRAEHARDPVEQRVAPVDKSGKPISTDEYVLQLGYDEAAKNKIRTHAACLASYRGLRLIGCHKYVTEHKGMPPHVVQGDWGSGKTTAKCRAEVEAYWAAVTRDEVEKNGPKAPLPWTRSDWAPELKSCDNYDRMRVADEVVEPLYRLEAILRRLDQGGAVSPRDRETVRADTARVMAGPETPQRIEYLERVEKFNLYADRP